MSKKTLYENIDAFLSKIQDKQNVELIESIRKGAKACFEGVPGRDSLVIIPMKGVMPLSTPFFNRGEAALDNAMCEDDEDDFDDDDGHGEGFPNVLKGGEGDDLQADDVDPEELEMGIEMEMEHSPDRETAADIAFDHLKEIPDYYTRLKKMEEEAKAEWAEKRGSAIDECGY